MSSNTDRGEVVQLRPTDITPEERARRVQVEVERRACQSTVEWMFWLPNLAEQHGIPEAKLKQMIEAQVRANEKKEREAKAEQRKREQRIERQRADARRDQERQQRAQEQADREAKKQTERKQREREKEFATLLKLPSTEHEPRIVALRNASTKTSIFCAMSSHNSPPPRKRATIAVMSSHGRSRSTRGHY